MLPDLNYTVLKDLLKLRIKQNQNVKKVKTLYALNEYAI